MRDVKSDQCTIRKMLLYYMMGNSKIRFATSNLMCALRVAIVSFDHLFCRGIGQY